MPLAALNRITGEVEVVTKRGKVMQGKIGTKRLAHVRSYLRLRPETSNPALLITEAGKAVSYWGGHMIWRRIQKRSGVQTPGQPPDLRVFGQGMARPGRRSRTSRMCSASSRTRWRGSTRGTRAASPRRT